MARRAPTVAFQYLPQDTTKNIFDETTKLVNRKRQQVG
jgi:hypothetical protein